MLQWGETMLHSTVTGGLMFTQFTDGQPVADDLKRLVNDAKTQPQIRKVALHSISRFEKLVWQPRAFEDAIAATGFSFDGQGFSFDRSASSDDLDAASAVIQLVDNYVAVLAGELGLTTSAQVYSVDEAADYLGMSVQGVKYHVYQSKLLRGEVKGKSLVFTKAQLDAFREIKPARRGPRAADS